MRREYACTLERFKQDVANHEMTVLRDDGVHRHVRFKRRDSSTYYFDLITWPGSLLIDGDCGTYAFKRLNDMFEFFRASERHPDGVNPSYWAEKVTAACYSGVEKFSWETFQADVKDHFDQCFPREVLPDDATEEDRAADLAEFAKANALWSEIQSAMRFIDQDEYGAVAFIRDFEHEGFRFQDWERDSKEYTVRFIWNLRAIVWGIAKYDALKAAAREAANDDGSERITA